MVLRAGASALKRRLFAGSPPRAPGPAAAIRERLDDTGGPRRFARNFGWLSMSRIAGDLLTFVLFVVLSRAFGQEGVGQYAFAMGLTGFFAAAADFGLYNLTVKELSRHQKERERFLSSVLALRLALAAGALLALLLLLVFLPLPPQARLIVVIIGVYQVVAALATGLGAAFVAHEAMAVAGLLEAVARALGAATGAALVLAGSDMATALMALPAAAVLQAITAATLISRRYGLVRPSLARTDWLPTLREALPYGLSVLIRRVSIRLDVVLLGLLVGTTAVGIYSAAYRVIFMVMFLPLLASVAVLPRVSRAYASNAQADLSALYHQSLRFAVLLGLPSLLGIWLIAPDLVRWLFGADFEGSVWLLRLLAPLFFLECLRSLIAAFLTGCDLQAARTRSEWLAAGVNLAGNLLLISALGTAGAAIATVVAELTLVIVMAMRLSPLLGWPEIGSRMAFGGVASAAFWVPLTFLVPMPIWAAVPAAIILYLLVLLAFREIRQNEAKLVMKALAR
jgi:O-antigen/teichoic acid export membrane protein